MFKLVIAEKLLDFRTIWQKAFLNIGEAVIIDADFTALKDFPGLDAVVMAQRHALERFGGLPAPGQALVIATQNAAHMPDWVVTTAPLLAHFEKKLDRAGNETIAIIQNQELSFEDETFLGFAKIFEAIIRFNQSSTNCIQLLGIAPAVLRSNQDLDSLLIYTASIKKAYLQYLSELNKSC